MDALKELLKKFRAPKDADTGLPKKYVSGLTEKEKEQQAKAIQKTREFYKRTGKVQERPKVSSTPSRRSPHVIKFEKRFGFPITELSKVKREFPNTDVEKILAKGRAAYASGSRPNQTPDSWANARLASVLTGGKSLAVDKDLVGPADLKKIQTSK